MVLPTLKPASSSSFFPRVRRVPVTLGTALPPGVAITRLTAEAGATGDPAAGSDAATRPAVTESLGAAFCGPTCRPLAASWRAASSGFRPASGGTLIDDTARATATCTVVPGCDSDPASGFWDTMLPA